MIVDKTKEYGYITITKFFSNGVLYVTRNEDKYELNIKTFVAKKNGVVEDYSKMAREIENISNTYKITTI